MPETNRTEWKPAQRWVHYLAVALACATFPLVIVGGIVTTARVGMADTVWPTPPWYFVWLVAAGQAMDRGLGFLIEHGHRQLGWVVGGLTLGLAVSLWYVERRGWLRRLGLAALAAVIVQGVLGGLRVIYVEQSLALVHGVFAQLFFALAVCLAAFTGRAWQEPAEPLVSNTAGRLRRLAVMTTGFIIVQLIFGATLRHLGYTWALVLHLVMAFIIVVHVALIARRVFIEHAMQSRLVRPVELLAGLVLAQLMLGVAAWGTSRGFGLNLTTSQSGGQLFFATAHVSVGALILATGTLFTVQTFRLLTPSGTGAEGRLSERSQRTVSGRPTVSPLESRELWSKGVPA